LNIFLYFDQNTIYIRNGGAFIMAKNSKNQNKNQDKQNQNKGEKSNQNQNKNSENCR
jgi:hypothetical protein